MNAVKVVGIDKEYRSFKTDNGREVFGKNIYYIEERSTVEGFVCSRLYLTKDKFESFKPETKKFYYLWYNRFGKVEDMELVSDEKDK